MDHGNSMHVKKNTDRYWMNVYCVQNYLNTLATVSVQYCGYSATKWLIDGCMVSNVSDIAPMIFVERICDCSYGIQKQITNQKTAFCSKCRLVASKIM